MFLTLVTAALCAAIFVRLFTYQRYGAKFRPGVSLIASLAMALSGGVVILTIDNQLHVDQDWWPIVVPLTLFTAVSMRCHGNVADVIRHIEWLLKGGKRK